MFYNASMNTTNPNDCKNLPLYALICAAGVGARAGGDVPKQYQSINGQPMLWHTIAAFAQADAVAQVYVVISPNDGWFAQTIAPLIAERGWTQRVTILSVGGDTRADSVCNGLAELDAALAENDEAWVMVHDAARPCLQRADLERLLAVRERCADAGALLAVPVRDTMKRTDGAGNIVATVEREQLWHALTPQMFRFGPLMDAID